MCDEETVKDKRSEKRFTLSFQVVFFFYTTCSIDHQTSSRLEENQQKMIVLTRSRMYEQTLFIKTFFLAHF